MCLIPKAFPPISGNMGMHFVLQAFGHGARDDDAPKSSFRNFHSAQAAVDELMAEHRSHFTNPTTIARLVARTSQRGVTPDEMRYLAARWVAIVEQAVREKLSAK